MPVQTEEEITQAVETARRNDKSPEQKHAEAEAAKRAAGDAIPFLSGGVENRIDMLVRGLVGAWAPKQEFTKDEQASLKADVDTAFTTILIKAVENREEFADTVRERIIKLLDTTAALNDRGITLPGHVPAVDVSMALMNFKPSVKLRDGTFLTACRIYSGKTEKAAR